MSNFNIAYLADYDKISKAIFNKENINNKERKRMLIMGLLEELKTLNVDVEEAKERFMGNVSLYEKMLFKFLGVMEEMAVDTDFDGNDYAEVIEKTHAIKGATGNLSIRPMYDAYSEIVRLLREQQPEQARKVLADIIPVQNEIIACIKKYNK